MWHLQLAGPRLAMDPHNHALNYAHFPSALHPIACSTARTLYLVNNWLGIGLCVLEYKHAFEKFHWAPA